MKSIKLHVFIVYLVFLNTTYSLYCEPENCYDILQISSSSTSQEIKKAYRTLARRYHPDKNKYEDTTQLFQKINTAYEILDNPNTRQVYDLFLRDPMGSRAYHTYQYYKASYSPQTNPFLVLAIFILLLSWLQWVMRKQMYQHAFNQIVNSQKFKIRVNQECAKLGKKDSKYYKDEIAEKLQEQISIEGGYSQPVVWDLLAFRIIIFPYTILMFFYSWFRWIGKYYIKRDQYTKQDSEYLTIKALKIPKAQWKHLQEDEKMRLLMRKLWIRKNMENYRDQMRARQLEELKISNPAKYRKVMAYLKKNA